MTGNILKPYNLQPIVDVTITSYSLPFDTIVGASGQCVVTGDATGYDLYALSLDDFPNVLFFIEKSTYANGLTTLTVRDISGFFNGLFSTNYTWDYSGGTNFHDIIRISAGEKDASVQSPAVSMVFTDDAENYVAQLTPDLVQFAYSEDIRYNACDYIALYRWLRAHGLTVSYWVDFGGTRYDETQYLLRLLFDLAPSQEKTIVFGDGHSELISKSFESKVISSVEFFSLYYGGNTRGYAVLYSDGTINILPIGDAIDNNQMAGQVCAKFYDFSSDRTINTRAKCEEETKNKIIEEVFSLNEESHKIEFASDIDIKCGEMINLVLDDRILHTSPTTVMVKSNDNRKHYICGEMQVTATDKLRLGTCEVSKTLPLRPYKGQIVLI